MLAALALVAGCAGPTPGPPAGSETIDPGELAAAPVPATALAPPAPDFETTRERWTFASYPGYRITTPHYRIHTTVAYEDLLDRLPVFLEFAMHHYRTALAPLPVPGRRVETYLFQDRRQWRAKTRQLLPDQASTFETLGRGGYTTRGVSVLYYIDWAGRYRDTFAIAAHEGWHQYTQSTFANPLPIWLEEGIATYMEGYRFRRSDEVPEFQPWRNWERGRALREALRNGEMIPLRELMEQSPQAFLADGKERLLTYYAQVWALARFIADGADGKYRGGLERALVDAAEGRLHTKLSRSPAVLAHGGRRAATSRTGPWLVLAYLNSDLAQFEAEYLEYADKIAN